MPSRCQYVSGLFLQCNNLVAEPTPSTSGIAKSSSSTANGGDAGTSVFCDKHASFIDAVKCHANISKRALDPDFKGPPNLLFEEDAGNRSAADASHVFEPCCSDSWTHDEENPLRNAGFLTEKEITRQQEAAVTRMLDRVNDLRSMLRIRFIEHLKQKPAVMEERKKLKLSAKNETERARMLRLKGDMSYAPYNKHVSVFLDKCRRKHQAEAEGQRGHINPDMWLEDVAHKEGEQRCTFVHEQPISPFATSYLYQSPPTDDVEAILRSVCDAVVKREEALRDAHRCRTRRVPMTDFCAEHFNRDAEATLFAPCTVCKEPSLSVDGQLCRKHARALYTKPPPEPAVAAPPLHPRSQTPVHADRTTASRPSLGAQRPPMNGAWKVANPRTLPPMQVANGLSSPVPANGTDSRQNLAAYRSLPIITRKPRDPHRQLADEERLSNEHFFVNQNAPRPLVGDGITSVKIDDDLPEEEFAEVCKKRRCLDEYEEIPLDKQPVADLPPQTLRVNGYNGSGISPMAVISVPHSLSDSVVFNPTTKTSGRATGACARVRPFVGSKELKNQPAAVILNKMTPVASPMTNRIITMPAAGRMIRIRENRMGSFARPPQFMSPATLFAHHQPPTLRIAATTTAKGPPHLVPADTRKTTHLH